MLCPKIKRIKKPQGLYMLSAYQERDREQY